MLKKIKIGTKAMLGFVVMALLAGIIAWVGVAHLKTLKQHDTVMYEKVVTSLGDVSNILNEFQRVRSAHFDMILSNDLNAIQHYLNNRKESSQHISKLLEKYKQSIMDDQENQLYINLSKARKDLCLSEQRKEKLLVCVRIGRKYPQYQAWLQLPLLQMPRKKKLK